MLPWPAAPPARPPPPPRSATPSSPRRRMRRHLRADIFSGGPSRTRIDPCPGGADKGRWYGALRLPGTLVLAESPIPRGAGTLDVLTSEYLLRSRIVKHSTIPGVVPGVSTPVPHSL